jgi:hypothetical protein
MEFLQENYIIQNMKNALWFSTDFFNGCYVLIGLL